MDYVANLLPGLSNRRLVVILEHEPNALYFKYLWAIILRAQFQKSDVTIIDCDWDYHRYSKSNHDSKREEPISKLRDKFIDLVKLYTQDRVCIVKVNADQVKVPKDNIKNIKTLADADKFNSQLGNSIRSVFAMNYLAASNITLKGRRMKKEFKRCIQSFLSIQMLCERVFESNLYDSVLIANGRFPSQAAARTTAEKYLLNLFFYEHGLPMGERFHFAPFQTQEFVRMQQFIKSQIQENIKISQEEIISFADDWLSRQTSDLKQNPFITNENCALEAFEWLNEKPLAVLFTSSIDERFSNLGVELNGWTSQKQATLEIVAKLKKEGFEVLVRIHPNTANKAWWDLINTVQHLESAEISYILPWSAPSSYVLLNEASLVLTWGSTISMEAIARGIPTVVYGRTMHDELSGAVILDPSCLESINFKQIARPNPTLGKIAIYFDKHWGYEVKDYCNTKEINLIDLTLGFPLKYPNKHEIKVGGESKFYMLRRNFTEVLILLRRLRKGRYSTPNDFRRFVAKIVSPRASDILADYVVRLCLKLKILINDGEISV